MTDTALSAGAILNCFLISVFALSSWHKFGALSNFRIALQDYNILPRPTIPLFSILFPVAELAGAAMIFANQFRTLGLNLIIALSAVYFAAVSINLLRGSVNFDCGCHWSGNRSQPSSITMWHASRPLVMGLLASAALPFATLELSHFDWGLAVLMTAPFAILYQTADTFILNWSLLRPKHVGIK